MKITTWHPVQGCTGCTCTSLRCSIVLFKVQHGGTGERAEILMDQRSTLPKSAPNTALVLDLLIVLYLTAGTSITARTSTADLLQYKRQGAHLINFRKQLLSPRRHTFAFACVQGAHALIPGRCTVVAPPAPHRSSDALQMLFCWFGLL
jgi:hypothetical protein